MENIYPKNNPVLDKSFSFAVQIIKFCESLQEQKQFIIANQLLRSGTSIGANCREAQNAESKLDFIHKFKIAAKEAEETEYRLLLCKATNKGNNIEVLLSILIEIKKLLNSIIVSSKTSKTHPLTN